MELYYFGKSMFHYTFLYISQKDKQPTQMVDPMLFIRLSFTISSFTFIFVFISSN